jgi:four helix bundle protein
MSETSFVVLKTPSMPRARMMDRTKKFALRLIHLVSKLPKNNLSRVVGGQLLRSATSIGANYREAARSSMKKHFTAVLTTALREADETLLWLELLADSQIVKPSLLRPPRRVQPTRGNPGGKCEKSSTNVVTAFLTSSILDLLSHISDPLRSHRCSI